MQHYDVHGIAFDNPRIDVPKMIARKDKIVKQLTGGIAQLFKANKVAAAHATGTLLAGNRVQLTAPDGKQTTVQSKHVILASGSVPISIPNVEIDNKYILDNAGALNLTETPKRFGVIGAGVIGLELGSVWNRLGSEVVIFEAMDTFLGAADQGIAKEIIDDQVHVTVEHQGEQNTEVFDRLLVAVGRKPNTEGLLAPDCGVTLTDRGQIEVDEECRTKAPNVWAIGDAVRGPMLAHKASEEGIAVAERIAGQKPHRTTQSRRHRIQGRQFSFCRQWPRPGHE